MQVRRQPDAAQKLARMGNVTLFEPGGEPGSQEKRIPQQKSSLQDCVSLLQTPKGPMPVLKTLLTTACERNCNYCPFRAGRSQARRVTFRPEELAKTFDQMVRARMVDGLFLSSGIIKGSVTTQDKLLDTIDIVRRKYRYRGYVHLKVMPGAEEDQLLRAMQLADRVSINLEGPTPQRLRALAPKKDLDRELLNLLQMASKFRRERHERLASLATQFVVGAVGDTDLELLALGDRLYNQLGLARTYFSAFHPVVGTPFENLAATPAIREFRLYQSSFLLRDYQWELEDMPFVGEGNLRLDIDPKRAWAEDNLRHAPLDLMKAERTQLLRVPGIGPKSAQALLRARRQTHLRDISQLRALGIRAPEQILPFILLDGGVPCSSRSCSSLAALTPRPLSRPGGREPFPTGEGELFPVRWECDRSIQKSARIVEGKRE